MSRYYSDVTQDRGTEENHEKPQADSHSKRLEGWRRLHNEEHHNLFTSQNMVRRIISRRMRWAGHLVRAGEMRNVYSILVGKLKGRRSPLGRCRCRWEDNVKMDLIRNWV